MKRCPKADSSAPASGSLAMISSGTYLQYFAGALGGEFGRPRSNSNSTESVKRLGSVMDNLEPLKSIASSRLRTEDASQQQRAPAVDVSSPPDMPYLRCMRSKPKLFRQQPQQHRGTHLPREFQIRNQLDRC